MTRMHQSANHVFGSGAHEDEEGPIELGSGAHPHNHLRHAVAVAKENHEAAESKVEAAEAAVIAAHENLEQAHKRLEQAQNTLAAARDQPETAEVGEDQHQENEHQEDQQSEVLQ